MNYDFYYFVLFYMLLTSFKIKIGINKYFQQNTDNVKNNFWRVW